MHLLRVVEGAVTHTHLCPDCAQSDRRTDRGFGPGAGCAFGVSSSDSGRPGEATRPRCSHPTGKTVSAACVARRSPIIEESGMVGCPNCYQVFADDLQKALEGGAKPAEHMGKVPRRGPENDALRHEMMRLERMLRELVECERFEEAAGVRDRLTELGEKLEEGPS